MPLDPKASKDEMFDELGKGDTYSKTLRKRGRRVANKQRVAIVLSAKRKARGKRSRKVA